METAIKLRRLIATLLILLGMPAFMLVACAGQSDPSTIVVDDDANGNQNGDPAGICLLNNCHSDIECQGCQDERTTCLVDENRCVACDPVSGSGCDSGEKCSPYGICVPQDLTCPTDAQGEPQVSCSSNSDCKACSPMHQVCDTAVGKCQACTTTNTAHCLQSDICVDGACSPKCPSACTTDNDCGQCGGPGNEAHACNAHKCAECSDTYPCPSGLQCNNGSCTPQCGIPGPVAGSCLGDEDCAYCGDTNAAEKWDCKKAINSGSNDHGVCGPPAAGCSDLGQSVAVLPEPWDDVTNLCSHDSDCSGVGVTYNVGKLIRDSIGSDKLDLGFTKVTINDANVTYAMNKCADVTLTSHLSCGVCVPCEVDSDCAPINFDQVLSDLFKGEPLAQIAAALLLDLLYGDNPEHNLNFFCQPVAAGYGICAPCSNPFQACGQTNGGPSSGNHGGSCDHGVCETGNALSAGCDSCVSSVCSQDSYCCDNQWDQICVDQAKQICGSNVCNSGGGANACAHSECSAGAKLAAGCSSCASSVCTQDPYCCNTEWDQICADMVPQVCGANTCNGGGSNASCSHSECDAGGKLAPNCSSCATSVCAQDPYCCDTEWDQICVDMVAQACGASTCGGNQNNACTHSECSAGDKLNSSCSSCASSVCAADPYCCNTEWDSVCVGLVPQYCGANTCGGGGQQQGGGSCGHSECSAGSKLSASCSSCAGSVCAADPYCCDTEWDSVCVGLVPQYCGASTCGGGNSCAHSECSAGGKLGESCSSCASAVCTTDPYCCDTEWDSVCVDQAEAEAACSC